VNFQYGSSLAKFQDDLFAKYVNNQPITDDERAKLINNVWVDVAQFSAPSNLIVRQYCLADLVLKMDSMREIIKLIQMIAYFDGDNYALWAEGYSYWGYTKSFLVAREVPRAILDNVDKNFQKTAYLRNGVMYPAPFGDLWDSPLEDGLQDQSMIAADTEITPIVKHNLSYSVRNKPRGCNTHVPDEDSQVIIVEGIPRPFRWYEGYDKKYRTKWEEIKDTLAFKRLKSIPELILKDV